jgi:hypothetical protein
MAVESQYLPDERQKEKRLYPDGYETFERSEHAKAENCTDERNLRKAYRTGRCGNYGSNTAKFLKEWVGHDVSSSCPKIIRPTTPASSILKQ